jgi:hypothetical protein
LTKHDDSDLEAKAKQERDKPRERKPQRGPRKNRMQRTKIQTDLNRKGVAETLMARS